MLKIETGSIKSPMGIYGISLFFSFLLLIGTGVFAIPEAFAGQVVKIWGSGFNYPESPYYRASFSVDVDQIALTGSVEYKYSRNRIIFESSAITGISSGEGTAVIEGVGLLDGATNCSFTVTTVDGSPDGFGISIRKDGADYFISDAKPLGSGDFVFTNDSTGPTIDITEGPSAGMLLNNGDVTCSWTGSDNFTPSQSLQYSYRIDSEPWLLFSSETSKYSYQMKSIAGGNISLSQQ